MRYYAIVDEGRPDPRDPWSVFRTPDRGGPPMELWDPDGDTWDEDVSLIDYFTGDDMGAVLIPEGALGMVQDAIRNREDDDG